MTQTNNKNVKWSIYVHIFPNGKKYIGITSQKPIRRWGKNGNGYTNQGLVWNAIQKYGWDNIEHYIIAEAFSLGDAEMLEKLYIALYRSDNRQYGYNIKEGGFSAKGHKLSEETRKKMSESRKKENNWIYGKHLSEETKAKLSEAHKGKVNIQAIMRGAEKRKGEKAYNARRVKRFDMNGNFVAEYGSLIDGAKAAGVRVQDIYSCCTGKQKSTHGTKWTYSNVFTENNDEK